MNNLTRAITGDGSAFIVAVDTTEALREMENLLKPSAVVSAALGRLLTASALMASQLKGEKDKLTLRMNGGGPAGTLIAVADACGNIKGSVTSPIVEIPLNEKGKLDVKGAVGESGVLHVIKDMGLKEPYVGQSPIVSGEIAEDIAAYYANSEQTPTVCALGVLVNPDLSIKSGGGFLIQLLPYADKSCISVIEENVKNFPPISQAIADGMTPQEICLKLLDGLSPDILDHSSVSYRCDCSRERTGRILQGFQDEVLQEMIDDPNPIEVQCHFCNTVYSFSDEDLKELLKRKESKQ